MIAPDEIFFSVVIPSYNRGGFLPATIKSVIEQDFDSWECIVVDDGSTDNTKSVVRELSEKDSRIKYVYQKNQERSVARNNGFSQSKGSYICFLDSDDSFLSNHLSTLYDQIKIAQNKTALFFTNALQKNQQGVINERNCPDMESISPLDYILQFTFNPARVAIHSEILKDLQFDPLIPGLEDLDLWLRIAVKHPIIQIKKRTIIYNLHENTYTLGDDKRFQKELKNFSYIFNKTELRRKLNGSLTNRLLSMCHYHLAIQYDLVKLKRKVWYHAIKSFLLCPPGYNKKTNYPLFIVCLYNIPFFGSVIKKVKKVIK